MHHPTSGPQNSARTTEQTLGSGRRMTRRRSSAGPATPVAPQRPLRPLPPGGGNQRKGQTQGPRPTYLTLRDHGKVYVADLPRLSDGQLSQIAREARDVLESLERRLQELNSHDSFSDSSSNDMHIRAATKRDVTERFLRAIDEEQALRRNNPALRAAAGESLPRAFLELARHRLPGSTFDALLQEALEACGPAAAAAETEAGSRRLIPIVRRADAQPPRMPLPVVLTLETEAKMG
jgi:hypothetical protein